MPENIELLTAHHLPYRVVNIIENAEQFVVPLNDLLTLVRLTAEPSVMAFASGRSSGSGRTVVPRTPKTAGGQLHG